MKIDNQLKTILFIEDEAPVREIVKRLWDGCKSYFRGDVEFLACASWQEGVQIMAERKIDVLLLDLTLLAQNPVFTQERTIDQIKAFNHSTMPVVVVSGDSSEHTRIKCFMAGAVDYVTKTLCMDRPECLMERSWNEFIQHRLKYGTT